MSEGSTSIYSSRPFQWCAPCVQPTRLSRLDGVFGCGNKQTLGRPDVICLDSGIRFQWDLHCCGATEELVLYSIMNVQVMDVLMVAISKTAVLWIQPNKYYSQFYGCVPGRGVFLELPTFFSALPTWPLGRACG